MCDAKEEEEKQQVRHYSEAEENGFSDLMSSQQQRTPLGMESAAAAATQSNKGGEKSSPTTSSLSDGSSKSLSRKLIQRRRRQRLRKRRWRPPNGTVLFLLAIHLNPMMAAAEMDCYFNANTTQIVDLPRSMTCSCSTTNVDKNATEQQQHGFQLGKDIFANFPPQMVANLETISISNCSSLALSSNSSETIRPLLDSGGIDLVINDIDDLVLTLIRRPSNETILKSLSLVNVNAAQISFEDQDSISAGDSEAFTLEEIYFYAMIGSSALFLITLVVLIILLTAVCCRKGRKSRSTKSSKDSCCSSCCIIPRRGKTVSRAASWRYESNMFVNPNERQQRRPGGGIGHVDYGVTGMALQQMLPYHMVPQREASQFASVRTPQSQRSPFMQQRETMDSNKYTDTSLQYVDEDSEYEEDRVDGATAAVTAANVNADLHNVGGNGGGGGGAEASDYRSNANSSSYSSTNRTSTLPIQT